MSLKSEEKSAAATALFFFFGNFKNKKDEAAATVLVFFAIISLSRRNLFFPNRSTPGAKSLNMNVRNGDPCFVVMSGPSHHSFSYSHLNNWVPAAN